MCLTTATSINIYTHLILTDASSGCDSIFQRLILISYFFLGSLKNVRNIDNDGLLEPPWLERLAQYWRGDRVADWVQIRVQMCCWTGVMKLEEASVTMDLEMDRGLLQRMEDIIIVSNTNLTSLRWTGMHRGAVSHQHRRVFTDCWKFKSISRPISLKPWK